MRREGGDPIGPSPDISDLLDQWPYAPGQFNVRLIAGNDGEPRIQIRLDLGLLQMHLDGRPDGKRPEGYGSLLEYLEARADGLEPPSEGDPTEEQMLLDERDIRALREEASQYYHRYMALLALEDFDGVIRDTGRNLRMLDFVADHAEKPEDAQELESFRPYIMMVRARARASRALKDNEPKAAILAIDEGLDALRSHYESRGEIEQFEDSNEAELLRQMKSSLMPRLPVSQTAELRERLKAALAQENYELAAILRDELRMLGEDRT